MMECDTEVPKLRIKYLLFGFCEGIRRVGAFGNQLWPTRWKRGAFNGLRFSLLARRYEEAA
jgi:hypothetical protein